MFTLNEYLDGKLTALYIALSIVGIIVAIVLGFVSRNIVKNKNYPDELNHGFAWGFWLGLIGLIVCLTKPNYFETIQGRNGQPFNPNMMNMNNPYGYPPQGQNGVPPYGNQQYGTPMQDPNQFGAQQQQGGWQCTCGKMNDSDSNFCSICGSRRMF